MHSTIVVSGANSKYEDSLTGLVRSIQKSGFACDIGIIDAGLSAQFQTFADAEGCMLKPLSLDSQTANVSGDVPTGWKAALMKPHICDIFKGYETYIFLDADTWVQDRFALDYLEKYSADGALAVVSQRSRFHEWDIGRGNGVEFNVFGQPLRANWYTMFSRKSKLPRADKRLLASHPILNAGVFALRGDAPLWKLWQDAVIDAVQALPKGRQYAADQVGLGLAVYRNDYPLALLPEICNWMSAWRFDDGAGLFTETQPPFAPVGIVHLAGVDPANTIVQMPVASGGTAAIDLNYTDRSEK
jgi:hypothetical protein